MATLDELIKLYQSQGQAPVAESKPMPDALSTALIGLLPSIVGAGIGAAAGGAGSGWAGLAAGGTAGAKGLEAMQQAEQERKKNEVALAVARQSLGEKQESKKFEERKLEQARQLKEMELAQREKIESRKDLTEREKAAKAVEQREIPATKYAAAGFARRLEQSEEVFNELANLGYNRASRQESIMSKLPEDVQSEPLLMQTQAERNFTTAVLRRESGAAISPGEFATAEKQYFPRPGDSKAVLEQKRANRVQVMKAIQAEAGRALDQVPFVSSFPAPMQSQGGFKLPGTKEAVAGGMPKTVIQNGVEYKLNLNTGKYE
jgi:hypothetical protein